MIVGVQSYYLSSSILKCGQHTSYSLKHTFINLLSAFWGSGCHLLVRPFYPAAVTKAIVDGLLNIEPQPPHPHPAAPQDIVSRFNDILKIRHHSEAALSHSKMKLKNEVSAGSTTYNEFWDAPSRFWAPSRTIEDVEIQAVLVSVPCIVAAWWIELELAERWGFIEITGLEKCSNTLRRTGVHH